MLTPVYSDTIVFETHPDPPSLGDVQVRMVKPAKKKSGGFTKRLLKRAGKKRGGKRSAPE